MEGTWVCTWPFMRSVNSSCSVETCTGHSLPAGALLLARNATEGGVLFLYISTRLTISVKSHCYFALDALLSFTSSSLCKFKSSSKSRRVHTHPSPTLHTQDTAFQLLENPRHRSVPTRQKPRGGSGSMLYSYSPESNTPSLRRLPRDSGGRGNSQGLGNSSCLQDPQRWIPRSFEQQLLARGHSPTDRPPAIPAGRPRDEAFVSCRPYLGGLFGDTAVLSNPQFCQQSQ